MGGYEGGTTMRERKGRSGRGMRRACCAALALLPVVALISGGAGSAAAVSLHDADPGAATEQIAKVTQLDAVIRSSQAALPAAEAAVQSTTATYTAAVAVDAHIRSGGVAPASASARRAASRPR